MVSDKRNNIRNTSGQRILYDARGVRVKNSRMSGKFLRVLVFFILPYIVINGIIFLLATSKPSIDLRLSDTNDYVTTKAEFTVKNLLPLKSMTVSMEGEPVSYSKNGKKYSLNISRNGSLYVEAVSLNGMRASTYADVGILDDTAPSIDENGCILEDGNIVFSISDSQSGVDFDSIYGETETGEKVSPVKINRSTGTIAIPMLSDEMTIYYEDMVGNARQCSVSATEEGSASLEVEE